MVIIMTLSFSNINLFTIVFLIIHNSKVRSLLGHTVAYIMKTLLRPFAVNSFILHI